MALVQNWVDNDPTTPLSGARLTQLVAAVNEALTVPDSALAERLNDPESLAAKAVAATAKPRLERWANVQDYLDPDRVQGVTDDRPAFESARLTGKPVHAPTGHYYLSRSPAWGDGAVFTGDGKGRTVIHLLDTAAVDADLWSNESLTGTVQAYFSDFTLDGNCQRQGGLTGAGGSRSSTLCFRNVKYFYVDRVSSINAVLHGFDVTRGALDYPYAGDGVVATLRSTDVYFDQCDASNFGDDGFTCHSSDFVNYTRNIAYAPRFRTNNNAFEIDGDSRHITLGSNRSYGCYAGIEVKGHDNESAAQDVTINGHHDIGSVRSYNFRHIGFHATTDPTSTTARNIIATNLVSINANNDAGFQDEATPRALCISAFRGVSINGMTIIGRGGYAAGDSPIAIQYKSGDINLNGINITGWTGADRDISITSGNRVNISNYTTFESAARALYVGLGIVGINVSNVNATAPATGAQHGFDLYDGLGVELSGGINLQGYVNAVRSDGVNYPSVAAFLRRTGVVPAGLTRMLDLDPAKDVYISSALWATLTDIPAGSAGGYFVSHGRTSGGITKQTATRNTTTGTDQTEYWRIFNFGTKTAGPWNRVTTTLA